MAYEIRIEKSAIKQLAKLPIEISQKIMGAIENLVDNPHPSGCKKLKGRDAYRIRIGACRVIYEVVAVR
jgi:mRNA interferase RelE/StbE